jgi:anti-sigma factor RsiW
MECEDIHRLLDAHLHRELDSDDQFEAERHLILCTSCASLLQEHQEFRAVFRNAASGRKAPPQLDAAQRVAFKMGRRPRCSSVTYQFRYAPSSRLAGGPF